MKKILVGVLCWNNLDIIGNAINSLLSQTQEIGIIVVDNGSTDGSLDLLKDEYNNKVILKANKKNKGFSGGANDVFNYAINNDYDFVALLNSDAIANKSWVHELSKVLENDSLVGISTSKILKMDGKTIDTTGEQFYSWGISSPRGRDEKDKGQYDKLEDVFGASGGASMYRVDMLREIGFFDEDFFAYYEDADLSFRANLTGWKIIYNPKAIVEHEIGASSSKVSGLAHKMSIKNQMMLLIKNLPLRYCLPVIIKFKILWIGNIVSGIRQGYYRQIVFGVSKLILLIPKKLIQRARIQRSRRKKGISSKDVYKLITPGLPDLVKDNTTVKMVRKIAFWS